MLVGTTLAQMATWLAIILYSAAKWIAYSVWCYWGVHTLLGSRLTTTQAIKYGGLRFVIGLLSLLILIPFHLSLSETGGWSTNLLSYLQMYSPLRSVEWTLMYFIVSRRSRIIHASLPATIVWIFGGVIISFASDAVFWFVAFPNMRFGHL